MHIHHDLIGTPLTARVIARAYDLSVFRHGRRPVTLEHDALRAVPGGSDFSVRRAK